MASSGGAPGRQGRGWRSSLRLRLTAIGTLLAAGAFAVGGILLLLVHRHTLLVEQEQSVLSTAQAVAIQAAQGTMPVPIPMPIAAGVPRVQVLDAGNRVVTGDPLSARRPPMLTLLPGQSRRTAAVVGQPDAGAHHAFIAAVPVDTPHGRWTVVAAGSLDTVDGRTWYAVELAAVACAGSLIVVATMSWLVVGRAMRPVERLRSQVATITTSGDLTSRVPQAPGRDEIGRLARTLNEMLDVLEQSDQRQRRFVADAAHELRTPLAGITAFLEVAESHPATIDRDSLVRRLLSAHRRFGVLVNDLLTLAAIDSGAPARRTPVDLAGVVQDCVWDIDPGKVRLAAPPAGRTLVLGSEPQLSRVVTNLLDNAVRHARRAVTVELASSGAAAVLTVTDDGPGIAVPDREQIWERFVRLDDGRDRATGGTGLGLALVREIVEAHGGTAEVGDAGPGAVFTITLPLAPPDTVS